MSEQVKKLVPKLRFPEFLDTEDWTITTLSKLANRVTLRNKNATVSRVFTNSAVDGVVDQRDYFDKDIANQNNLENYFIVDQGCYVYNPRISNTAPVGPICKNKIGKGVMSPLYTVFKFHSAENDFYEQFFKTDNWYSYLRNISNSGARHDRMSISNDAFMKMPLPQTSPKEQQKIADCLSSLDDLITSQNQKVDALKQHKKGLMQQLFPAEGETVPKLRFPEFENEPWNIKPLGKVADNLDFKRVPITESDRKKGATPYYGASGIIDYVEGYIFDEDLLCISEDGANLVARTYPIAFSISGKTWVNNHAHVLKFKKKYTQTIIENYLNSISLEDYLTGMAQPKLNQAKLEVIPMPLPENEDEQKKIANLLSSMDELITTQIQKLEAYKIHKNGLKQQLFPSVKGIEK